MKNYYSLLLFYWLCLTSVSFAQTTISYTESTDIIANPERGLQKYYEQQLQHRY
jgi:hypothetical protein